MSDNGSYSFSLCVLLLQPVAAADGGGDGGGVFAGASQVPWLLLLLLLLSLRLPLASATPPNLTGLLPRLRRRRDAEGPRMA